MNYRAAFQVVLFGFAVTASNGVADTLTITKADDIHIVNKEGIIGAVADPNNGAAARLVIARFIC